MALKHATDATFEEVVPHEVDRIDTIVSRLLDFARPRPVAYTHTNIRRTIDEVAALIENQLRKAFVTVEMDIPDQPFFISGDDQQLHASLQPFQGRSTKLDQALRR